MTTDGGRFLFVGTPPLPDDVVAAADHHAISILDWADGVNVSKSDRPGGPTTTFWLVA